MPSCCARPSSQSHDCSGVIPGTVRSSTDLFEFRGEGDQVLAELFAERFVLQAEFHGCLQVAELAAAVVTLAFELVGEHRFVREQIGDSVGELDLAARATSGLFQLGEDRRRQQIATDYCERRRCVLRPRLLDDLLYETDATLTTIRRDD